MRKNLYRSIGLLLAGLLLSASLTAVSSTHVDATLGMSNLTVRIADLPTLAYQSVRRKISLWDAVS